MTLLIGALTLGLILALLALGVYVSFRIFNIPDMTAEGSVTLGASVAAALMVHGYNAVIATAAAFVAGTAAGAVTGILATKCRINALLSGIPAVVESVSAESQYSTQRASGLTRGSIWSPGLSIKS